MRVDNVEMEVVLPGTMTVIESHDVALALQHKIEMLSDVERAFVHVDHQGRDGLEHKVERQLVRKISSPVTGSTSPGRDNGENGGRNSIAMSPLSSTTATGISGTSVSTATSATTINGLNRFPRAAYDENNNSSFLHNNIHSAPSSHHHINTTQSDARSRNSYVSAPVRDLDTDYDPENCENYKTESLHKNSSSNNDKYFKSID